MLEVRGLSGAGIIFGAVAARQILVVGGSVGQQILEVEVIVDLPVQLVIDAVVQFTGHRRGRGAVITKVARLGVRERGRITCKSATRRRRAAG